MGFPSNLHVLYVDQLKATTSETSVVETVMDANKDVIKWRRQSALLQVRSWHGVDFWTLKFCVSADGHAHAVVQESIDEDDVDKLVHAVKRVKLEDMKERVDEAALINELRSGARGWDARAELLELEAKSAPSLSGMTKLKHDSPS